MRTLSAVDVVIEQIKETIEGLGEVVWLRLSDFNRINACHIIVATLV
jgi:hypothetical protein